MESRTQRIPAAAAAIAAAAVAAVIGLGPGPSARGQSLEGERQAPLAPVPYLGFDYTWAIPAFGPPPDAAFRRTVTGRFNDDPLPDVAITEGNDIRILLNPTDWDAVIAPPLAALDLAVLHGTAPAGRDELLAATPAGLVALAHVPGGGYAPRSVGTPSVWAGARFARVADLDGDGVEDLYGIDAIGDLVLAEGLGAGAFADEQRFDLGVEVTDLTHVDFDGDGSPELAAATVAGLRVVGASDGQIRRAIGGAVGGLLARMERGSSDREDVAWIGEDTGGDTVLFVVTASGVGDPVDFGTLGAVGLAAADWDLDGDADLVISHRRDWRLLFLRNRANRFGTEPGSRLAIPTGSGPSSRNQAQPLLADLDLDGDPDLFFPIRDERRAYVLLSRAVDERALAPRLVTPVLLNVITRGDGSGREAGILQLRILPAREIPPAATHLEVLIWEKPDVAVPTQGAVHPDRAFRFELPLEPRSQPVETGYVLLPNPEPKLFFWSQRYVAVDPETGERRAMFPARTFAMTIENALAGGPVLDWVDEQIVTQSFYSDTNPDPELQTRDGNIQSELVSTVIDIKPIIDFDAGTEPDDDFLFVR